MKLNLAISTFKNVSYARKTRDERAREESARSTSDASDRALCNRVSSLIPGVCVARSLSRRGLPRLKTVYSRSLLRRYNHQFKVRYEARIDSRESRLLDDDNGIADEGCGRAR